MGTKPNPEEERAVRPMRLVQVPRGWVREHGWPENYTAAVAEALAGTPGFLTVTRAQGEVVMESYRELDVAYVRQGPEDQAFLYVQAWKGAP